MNDLIENFIAKNDVRFKMIATVNGEEVTVFMGTSFDDVSGYATLAEEAFQKYVLQDKEDEIDLDQSTETDELIESAREL